MLVKLPPKFQQIERQIVIKGNTCHLTTRAIRDQTFHTTGPWWPLWDWWSCTVPANLRDVGLWELKSSLWSLNEQHERVTWLAQKPSSRFPPYVFLFKFLINPLLFRQFCLMLRIWFQTQINRVWTVQVSLFPQLIHLGRRRHLWKKHVSPNAKHDTKSRAQIWSNCDPQV